MVNISTGRKPAPPQRIYGLSGGTRPPSSQRQGITPAIYPQAPMQARIIPTSFDVIPNKNPNIALRAQQTAQIKQEQQAIRVAEQAQRERFQQITSGQTKPSLVKASGVPFTSTVTYTPDVLFSPTPITPKAKPVDLFPSGRAKTDIQQRVQERIDRRNAEKQAQAISQAYKNTVPVSTLPISQAQATSIFTPVPTAKPTTKTGQTILERRIAQRQKEIQIGGAVGTKFAGDFGTGFVESAKGTVGIGEKPTTIGDLISTTIEQGKAFAEGRKAELRYEDIIPRIQERGIGRLVGEAAFETAFTLGTLGLGQLAFRGFGVGARVVSAGAKGATAGVEGGTKVRGIGFGRQAKVSEGGLLETQSRRVYGTDIFGGDIAKAEGSVQARAGTKATTKATTRVPSAEEIFRADVAKPTKGDQFKSFFGKQPRGGTRPSTGGTGASLGGIERVVGGRGGQSTILRTRNIYDVTPVKGVKGGRIGTDFDVLNGRAGTKGGRGARNVLEPPRPKTTGRTPQDLFEDVIPRQKVRQTQTQRFFPVPAIQRSIFEIPTEPQKQRDKVGLIDIFTEPKQKQTPIFDGGFGGGISITDQVTTQLTRYGQPQKEKVGLSDLLQTNLKRYVPPEEPFGGGRGRPLAFKFPFGFGGGGGRGKAERAPSRRIKRLYDIASEPFGRIDVGLGFFVETGAEAGSVGEVFRRRGQRIPKLF